jgi:hypothetical protein
MSGGGNAGMGSPMGGQPSMGGGFGQPSMGGGFGQPQNPFGNQMGGGFGQPSMGGGFGQPSMGGGFGQPQNPFGNQMGGYGRQMGGFGGGYGGGFGGGYGSPFGGGFGQPMGGYGGGFGGGFGQPQNPFGGGFGGQPQNPFGGGFGGGFGQPQNPFGGGFGGQPQLQLTHELPQNGGQGLTQQPPPAWQQSDDWKGLMSQQEGLAKQMHDYARQYQPTSADATRISNAQYMGGPLAQNSESAMPYTTYAFSEGGLAGLAKGKK